MNVCVTFPTNAIAAGTSAEEVSVLLCVAWRSRHGRLSYHDRNDCARVASCATTQWDAAVIHVIYQARDGVLTLRDQPESSLAPTPSPGATPHNPACRPFQTFIRESFGKWIFAPLRALVLLLCCPPFPLSFPLRSLLDVKQTTPRSFRAAAAAARHELLRLDHPLRAGLQHMRRRHSTGTRFDCSTAWKGRGGQI